MTTRKGWMQTFSGQKFWPLDPKIEEIHIEDVAHALSNICRFNGHLKRFYSVGQHSVLVSSIVPEEYALWGLLHDAPEAYLGDLIRPIKDHSDIGELYLHVEERLMREVCNKFGLTFPSDGTMMPECVNIADNTVLVTEIRDLSSHKRTCSIKLKPLDSEIVAASPVNSEIMFLKRYSELTGENVNERLGQLYKFKNEESRRIAQKYMETFVINLTKNVG